MEPIPPFVYAYAEKLRPGGDLVDGLGGINHYLLFAERPADCAPLVLPLLPDALAAVPDFTEPEWIGKALARLGRVAVPLLVDLARSPHPELRETAAVAVAELKTEAVGATAAMTPLLTDELPAVRTAAGRALAAARPDGQTVRLLVELMADADEDVALDAIYTLRELAGAAADADPTLLTNRGPAADAVPALLANVGPTAGPARRLASLRALAWIGVPAAERGRFRHLLRRDWSDPAVDELHASLELEAVVAILSGIGPQARDCVADLEPLLAVETLFAGRTAEMGRRSPPARPRPRGRRANTVAVRRVGRHGSSDLRRDRLGLADPAVRERLKDVVARLETDPDEDVRDAVQPLNGEWSPAAKSQPRGSRWCDGSTLSY